MGFAEQVLSILQEYCDRECNGNVRKMKAKLGMDPDMPYLNRWMGCLKGNKDSRMPRLDSIGNVLDRLGVEVISPWNKEGNMQTTLLMSSEDHKFSLGYWKDLNGDYAFMPSTVANSLGLKEEAEAKELLGIDDEYWTPGEYDVIRLAKQLGNYEFIAWFAESMARLRFIHEEKVTLEHIAKKLDWLIGFTMGANAR